MIRRLETEDGTTPGQQRILLIEAEHEMFARIILLLEESAPRQYGLDWAGTFKFGLSLLRRHQYDLVLVRNRLGFHSGPDLIEAMRNAGIQTPAILLTEDDHAEYIDHSEFGIWDCLDISRFDGKMLIHTMREATANVRHQHPQADSPAATAK